MKTTQYLLVILFMTSWTRAVLGLGFAQEPPKDITVYESQNKYGTYAEKQRQIAIRQGIRPLVDTIAEHDKYGNDGGAMKRLSEAFVRKSEGLAASIGNAFQFPANKQRYIFKSVTSNLNRLGEKFLGLQ